ncbi:hypothetical protein BJX62DRAFT_222307 [Aspergillus germanicus]
MLSTPRLRVLPTQPPEKMESSNTHTQDWQLYIHNKSVNIYTHLIPAILFRTSKYYTQQYLAIKYPRVTTTNFVTFSIFMLAGVICLSLSAGVFGVLTIFITIHPKFQGAKYHLFQELIVFSISQLIRKAFPYTLAKAGCLLSRVSFYTTRFPKSQYPGKFDLFGSHSIFHILVVCAAVVQLVGYLDAFDYA